MVIRHKSLMKNVTKVGVVTEKLFCAFLFHALNVTLTIKCHRSLDNSEPSGVIYHQVIFLLSAIDYRQAIGVFPKLHFSAQSINITNLQFYWFQYVEFSHSNFNHL